MPDFADLPDGWDEVTYETGDTYHAIWASTDEHVAIDASRIDDGANGTYYTAVAYQYITDDGMEAEVQTHARTTERREQIEQLSAQYMREVNDGQHVLRVVGHEEWKEFIQFYCVSSDEIPESIDSDEVIDGIRNDQYDDTIEELPDDVDRKQLADETITVEVFPRHKTEIDGYNES